MNSSGSIKLKNIEKALLIAFVLAVACSFTSFFSFARECEDIPNRVLRLHVLANSDTKEDQQLKLYVRNRILTESAGLLDQATDRSQAEQTVRQNLPRLQAAAAEEIAQRGYDYPVGVELEKVYFTTRRYEQVTLPAGNYDALRVTIGQAQGKNWWCVMFPPMCLPAAEEKEELDDVLNPQQMEIVTGQYEIRFKSLELYEQLRNWAAGKDSSGKSTAGKGSSEQKKAAVQSSDQKESGKKSSRYESSAKESDKKSSNDESAAKKSSAKDD